MYRNLSNLVEKAAVQQAKIDRQSPTGVDSYDTGVDSYDSHTASSSSSGHIAPNLRETASLQRIILER